MQSLYQYITEAKGASLTVWDIDDTLFKSNSKVKIIRNGRVVKTLTPAEFNTYVPHKGETYDYGEFKSGKIFYTTAKPIPRVMRIAKKLQRRIPHTADSKVIIVTARSPMDDMNLFRATFHKYGFNIDKMHAHLTGGDGFSAADGKVRVFDTYLATGKYTSISLFDDSIPILRAALSLKHKYPSIIFNAYHVGHDGSVTKLRI